MGIATQESFGTLVRRYRRDAELTQEALAERAGLSVRVIRTIETDRQHRPRLDTVQLLLAALDVPAEEQAAFWAAAGQAGWNGMLAEEPQPLQAAEDPRGRARSPKLPGGFLGAHPAGPLVGRDAEHVHLVGIVDAAAQGIGRLVTIAGEPGAGKTRLGQELALDLETRGFLVATGRCFEQQERIPYAPFLDALPPLYAEAPASLRRHAAAQWPYLAPLLPDQLPPVEGSGTFSQGDQLQVFRALTRFLFALAAVRPVALLFDDLQWADGASLDLLRHLALHTREARVFLSGIHRPVSRRHPLQRALRDVAHDGLLEEIILRRLDRAGTAALLAGRLAEAEVSDQLVDLIHARAEGNPFFTMEIVRALTERGDISIQGDTWALPGEAEITVPTSVRLAIDERVGRLPDGVQTLLGQASVLGHTFTANELIAMSEQDTEEVNDALEAAVQAELLQERDGQAFAFSHVLVQHALYAELSGLRRRRLHLAAGRALETMPERRRRAPAELAWHFLEADDAAQALRYSLLAGDEAEGVFAHAGAEQHYRTAVTLAAELQDAPREAEAHEKLGKVLWILGRHDEALAALERALEMQEKAGNLDAEGRIAAAMGWVLADLGRPEEGACRLQIVTERLEASGPSPGLVELYTTLVHLCLRRGRRRDLPALAERAAALAQTARDGRMRAQAELVHGFALVHDRVDEALALFEDVIPAAEKAGDNRTWSRALLLAGRIYADRGEFERSRAYLERNMELHQRTGNGKWLADALRYRGELLVVQGDWSAARENYEQSIGMAVPFTSPIAAWIRLSLARLCLLEGTWQDADAYLEECAEAVERSGDRSSVPKLQALLAARDLWHGQADVALARLEPLASQFDLDHDQLMTLAEVYMMTGNIARAAEVVTGGAAWAAKQNSRLAGVDWRRLHGTLLAGQERWDEAERALSEAASLAAALTYPYAHARALYDWGLMCIQRRAREEAQGHLEAALAVFRRIGAHPFVERTEEALVEVR